jgi:FkbM family methyltransferase
MPFQYPLKNRIAFYWNYFISKVFCIWFEVKKPKVTMFLYEMLYSSAKFLDYSAMLPSPFGTDTVVTKFGTFGIRPHTVDMSNCSPAFERKDVDYLLKLVDRLRRGGKKIIFFDIGADIGTYTITVGNRFRDCDNLHIMAFEPSPSSFALLKQNVALNGLGEKVDAFNIALFNEDNRELDYHFNETTPGSSGLRIAPGNGITQDKVFARTLDAVHPGVTDASDVLILKMDVEGVEREVLIGAQKTLDSGKDCYLLVEDFVDPDIIGFLENIGARFICKLTPYNSWWHYRKESYDRPAFVS